MQFHFRLTSFAVILATLAVTAPAWSVNENEAAKIRQAVPKQATAKPQSARRVLVFNQALKYKHASIPYADKAFELMGEATGAYTVDISSDPAVFEPANLEKYDAIVLNNNTGEWLTTPTLRQSLLDFVRNGKGLVGIHAATDGNFEWAEFGELIGGYFKNHPWLANGTVTLKLDQPDHPVVQAFVGESLELNDEIYQIVDPYSREKVLELVSLDTEKTDMDKEGIVRTDGDFPVSWVHNYGEGRVFYTSIGHNEHLYSNPVVLRHYLDGLQFALGDLEAPADPAGNFAAQTNDRPTTGTAATAPVADDKLREALSALDDYDFGDNRDFLLTIDAAMRTSIDNPQQRQLLLDTLIEKANNNDLTYAARDLALRRIGEIASPESAESIAGLLASDDEKLAQSAVRALTDIPGDAAEQVLADALQSSNSAARTASINALGDRGATSNQVIGQLVRLANEGEPTDQKLAIIALGKIGTSRTADALLESVKPSDDTRETWLAALNNAADSLAATDRDLAVILYDRVRQQGADSPASLAAFRGKAELAANPEAVALRALDDGATGAMEQVARQILVRGSNEQVAAQLLQRLQKAEPEQKILMVEILGARGEESALQPISALAAEPSEESPELQVAALRALKQIGDESVVADLVKVAGEQRGEPATVAADTLKNLGGAEVDGRLVQLITDAPAPAQQVAAIEAAVARNSEGALDPLLQVAASDDSTVATAAFKALAQVASEAHLERLLEIHDNLREDRTTREAGRTITAITRGASEKAKAVSAVQAALKSADEDSVKASLLGVLGRVGGTMALGTLQEHLKDKSNPTIYDAAVRGLAEFPQAIALEDLMTVAAEADEQVHKVLAMRAISRLLTEGEGNDAPRLEMARKVLEMAPGADEKKSVIGAVADLKTTGVLDLLMPLLDQEELKTETAAAIITHAPIADQIDAAKTAEMLNPMRDKLTNEQWNKLEEALTPADEGAPAIRAFQISAIVDADTHPSESVQQPLQEPAEDQWSGIFWAGSDSGDNKGRGHLDRWYPDTKNSAVYLRTHVWSPEERTVELRTGSDDGMAVSVNGEPAYSTRPTRSFDWEADKEKIQLKRGWNTLLFKVVQGSGQWTVAARIVNEDGEAMSDLRYSALPQ